MSLKPDGTGKPPEPRRQEQTTLQEESMFNVYMPDNCHNERAWICKVMLHEFLGLPYTLTFDHEATVRIKEGGRTLEVADVFLEQADRNWLSETTMPARPLRKWHCETDARLNDPVLPVLFGAPYWSCNGNNHCVIGTDIFGAAFFMLSRYEEAICGARDEHDRFPARRSVACQEDFLHRPIVDEYVEVLWAAISRLWPRTTRRRRTYKAVVSCDVDHPIHPAADSLIRMARTAARSMVDSQGWGSVLNLARNYVSAQTGDLRYDPYYSGVNWIMDVNEVKGNEVAFYFIPEITDRKYDDTCSIAALPVMKMMQRIHARGHEIGVHPGYHTYQSKERTHSALACLTQALARAKVQSDIHGGRNHYLRWSTSTPGIWSEAGLRYDSTLAYAEQAGFRCGTCHEYPMYDLHARRALSVRQRPLVCMECTIATYMGLGYTEAMLRKINELKNAVRAVDGNFSLLWHNSNLDGGLAREIYCEAIT